MISIEVSIIMSAYNAELTIIKAIESILSQTFKNWELLIGDDASTDQTSKILKNYSDHPQIHITTYIHNRGAGAVRNDLISQARGPFIAIQDADDYSATNRIQILYNEIKQSKFDIIGSAANLVNQNDHWGIVSSSEYPLKNDWIKGMQTVHASIILKKTDIIKVGGYDIEKNKRNEDYLLLIKLIAAGKSIKNIPEALYNILYTKNDYKRRTFSTRLFEIKSKLNAIRLLKNPFYTYLYLLKPIILLFVPTFFQYYLHKIKFK